MTHSPYEAPEMIPEAEFVEAREQLRERRRIVGAVFVVIALVAAGMVYWLATTTDTNKIFGPTVAEHSTSKR
jgi:hypothetical protein